MSEYADFDDDKLKRWFYARISAIASMPHTSLSKTELKEDICTRVSGQCHWSQMSREQKEEALRIAQHEYDVALSAIRTEADVEPPAIYSPDLLIAELLKRAEIDHTPNLLEFAQVWQEIEARINYLQWAQAAIVAIIDHIEDEAVRAAAMSDFAKEVSVQRKRLVLMAKTYRLFGLPEVNSGASFEVCMLAAQSRTPHVLLEAYKKGDITIRQMKDQLQLEHQQGDKQSFSDYWEPLRAKKRKSKYRREVYTPHLSDEDLQIAQAYIEGKQTEQDNTSNN